MQLLKANVIDDERFKIAGLTLPFFLSLSVYSLANNHLAKN